MIVAWYSTTYEASDFVVLSTFMLLSYFITSELQFFAVEVSQKGLYVRASDQEWTTDITQQETASKHRS